MFPKENQQEFPATHWLMMASHGVGRYDSEDVRFTTELPTQEAKKEMTVQRMKENYKELGVKRKPAIIWNKTQISMACWR